MHISLILLSSLPPATTKEDIKLPADEPEISQKIKDAVENGVDMIVAVLSAMGEEKIVAAKESN